MASFYGGKPGIPFVIKETFKTIDEMAQAFSENNTEVGYGEYAMINNTNAENLDRGKVFKRTYGGYEEVGSFQGPQGETGPTGPPGPQGPAGSSGNSRKYCLVGTDNTGAAGWYKVASQTMSGYQNSNVTFFVTSTFENYYSGLLQLQMRCDNTSPVTCKTLKWHTRVGFAPGQVICIINGYTYTIYAQQTLTQYGRLMFEVLSESSDATEDSGIELFNSEAPENITATMASVVATDGFSSDADSLEQHLLTNENLDNLKPDKFTAYYAEEGNTVTSGPTSSSMGFSLFVYKTSQNYRVQDYIGLEGGERKTRYCTHSLTDENTIDDNGFNWGTNGKVLCKEKAYYIIWRDTSTNYFYICTSNSRIDAQNTYNTVSGTIYVYNSNTNEFDYYSSTYKPGNKNYYALLYSNQGNLVFGSGFASPAYGNADEIINSDTGWSEWSSISSGGEGEQGPTGPAGQSWITEIDPNDDGTYTLVIRTENSVSGPSGGPTA